MTAPPAPRPPASLLAAWQAALAAEHRACFGYPFLGPHLTADRQPVARTDQAAHEALRDATVAAVMSAGMSPVAPLADYPLAQVSDPASAVRLAVQLEDGCAAAWRYLYAQAAAHAGSDAIRPTAQAALTASAVRAAGWRRVLDPGTATQPFPGL